MIIEILDVVSVENYYRIDSCVWKLVETRTVPTGEGETKVFVFENEGCVFVKDIERVKDLESPVRNTIRDLRGWTLEWQDGFSYVTCLVYAWGEEEFRRVFEPVLTFNKRRIQQILKEAEDRGVDIVKILDLEGTD